MTDARIINQGGIRLRQGCSIAPAATNQPLRVPALWTPVHAGPAEFGARGRKDG